MSLLNLLLITALSIPTNTLVLKSGERIGVDGGVTIDDGRVLFRSGGALYTLPAIEVDLDATRETRTSQAPAQVETRAKLRVSREERDRLLRELEENHSGTAAPTGELTITGAHAPMEQQANEDEWSWRRQARAQDEGVRRAREELQLLQNRTESLKAHIITLLSLGFQPNQFTYDTAQLVQTQEQIPRAELELQRAQREHDQFRDDARRQGVTPGWLR